MLQSQHLLGFNIRNTTRCKKPVTDYQEKLKFIFMTSHGIMKSVSLHCISPQTSCTGQSLNKICHSTEKDNL
jgi:hypothetical protein